MGKCIMTLKKQKTYMSLFRMYEHNYRIRPTLNADEKLSWKNEELVPLVNSAGERTTFSNEIRSRLARLGYGTERKLRSDAVLAIEVVTSFSREDIDHINLNQWKEDNVKWLRKTFNAAPEKYGDNVLSVVYHADEPGNVHCHAVIIPVNENGRLSAKSYTNGPKELKRLQDEYAQAMEQHGLERGVSGSRARHMDIKKFYARINQAKEDVPQPLIGESMEQYWERATGTLEEIRLSDLRQSMEWQRKEQAKLDIQREKDKKMIDLYANGRISSIQGDIKELTRIREKDIAETKRIRQEKEAMEKEYMELCSSVSDMKQRLDLLKKSLAFYRDVHDPLEHARELNPDLAERIDIDLAELAEFKAEHLQEHDLDDMSEEMS